MSTLQYVITIYILTIKQINCSEQFTVEQSLNNAIIINIDRC